MSSSGSGTVNNYGSGCGSDFLTSYGSGSYGSGSGSGSKTLVPTIKTGFANLIPSHKIFTHTFTLQEEAGWKGKDNLMKTNTTLIICPASLMAQWENEIKAKVSIGKLSLQAVLLFRISIRIRIGSGFNGVPGSVFGSSRAEMTHKNIKS